MNHQNQLLTKTPLQIPSIPSSKKWLSKRLITCSNTEKKNTIATGGCGRRGLGLDADDGRRVGRLARGDGDAPEGRLPRPRPGLLRLPGGDAAGVGRRRRRAPRPGRAGDRGPIPGALRPGRRLRPDHRRAARVDNPAGDGAGDLGPQVGGRAPGHRPGGEHAPDHGHRTRRHPRLPGGGDPGARRPAGTAADAHGHQRTGLPPYPPRSVQGRRSLTARPRVDRQPGRDARRRGRLEGGGHDPVAGASPRRHHRGPGGGGGAYRG